MSPWNRKIQMSSSWVVCREVNLAVRWPGKPLLEVAKEESLLQDDVLLAKAKAVFSLRLPAPEEGVTVTETLVVLTGQDR